MGEIAGVAGDDRSLVADGGRDDDGVDDISGARGGAGYPGGPAGALVVGNDVAGFEDLGDLVLGAAAPGLGKQILLPGTPWMAVAALCWPFSFTC